MLIFEAMKPTRGLDLRGAGAAKQERRQEASGLEVERLLAG
jgi:hypothetical protein